MRKVFVVEREVVRGDEVVGSECVCLLTPRGRSNWSKGMKLSDCVELDLSGDEKDRVVMNQYAWKDELGPEFVECVMSLSC